MYLRNGQVNTFRGTIYFAIDGTRIFLTQVCAIFGAVFLYLYIHKDMCWEYIQYLFAVIYSIISLILYS